MTVPKKERMKVYHIYANGKTIKDITNAKKGDSKTSEGQYNLMFHPERKMACLTKNVISIPIKQLENMLGEKDE